MGIEPLNIIVYYQLSILPLPRRHASPAPRGGGGGGGALPVRGLRGAAVRAQT